MTGPRASIPDRLQRRLKVTDSGCIEWTGYTNRGYGRIGVNGGLAQTHRLAWILAHGPIPDGLDVLHHCDNPPCCNVEHLFLGTDADNAADMITKGRSRGGEFQRAITHCPANHKYTEANTYVTPNGWRRCRACNRDRQARRYRLAQST